MKLFLKKILIFLFIQFLPLWILFEIGVNLVRNKIEIHDYIILGDSQTEFLSNSKVYNRSILGSAYFVHFHQLQAFKNEFKGKIVFVASNFNSFSKLYQNRLQNERLFPGWKENVISEMNRFNWINQRLEELQVNNSGFNLFDLKKIKNNLIEQLYNIPKKNSNHWVRDTTVIFKDIQRHWLLKEYIEEDVVQKKYFEKLIVELKKLNCQVYILKMPLTTYYKNRIPAKAKLEYDLLMKKNKLNVIDLDKLLNLSHNYKLFKDYGHLNAVGDSIVNSYMKKLIIPNLTHKCSHEK